MCTYTLDKNIYDLCCVAPLLGADLPEIIDNEYIVVFESIDRVSSQQGVNKRARDTSYSYPIQWTTICT